MKVDLWKKILLVMSITAMVLGFASFTAASNVISAKPFESVRIKTGVDLSENSKYLTSIKIAYDSEGEALADEAKLTYDKKNPYILIVTPISAGWRPETNYYVITGAYGKQKAKVYQIKTKPYECKTISGTVKLEPGEKAYVDMDVEISATTFDDVLSYYTTRVKIPEGKQAVNYTMKVPVNVVGYSLSYDILSGDNESSINAEYYTAPGYIDKNNKSNSYQLRKLIILKGDLKQDITIVTDKVLHNKVKEIIGQVIKPGMSEYEKEVALYSYVIEHIAYDYEGFEDLIHRDSYLYAGLIKNKTWCVGYASIMKLLLNTVGIECHVIEGGMLNADAGHAWNIVKINGKYYHLDATRRSMNYLNFTKDHAYLQYGYLSENSQEYPCDSYEYNYNFRSFWINNGIDIGKMDVIKGVVSLPEAQKAPAEGRLIRVVARSENTTLEVKDDFFNVVYVMIPAGQSSVEFAIKVIPTEQSYRLLCVYNSNQPLLAQVGGYQLKGTEKPKLILEPLRKLNIKLTLADAKATASKAMMVSVASLISDKGAYTEIFDKREITIPVGESSVETYLWATKTHGPYMLQYTTLNKEEYPEYQHTGYYSQEAGSSPELDAATAIEVDDEDIEINLLLK